jgi:hypothetical protein
MLQSAGVLTIVVCQGLFPFGSFKTRPSYKCVERSKVSAWGEQNQFSPSLPVLFLSLALYLVFCAQPHGNWVSLLALLMLQHLSSSRFFSLNVTIKL